MKNALLILLFLVSSCSGRKSDSSPSTAQPESASEPVTLVTNPDGTSQVKTWTEEYMDLVNSHRKSKGLPALIHVEGLGEIAAEHSYNMARGYVSFGHDGFSQRCDEARGVMNGGNWCGENVASGQSSPKSVFNAWMNSSGHRANIESTRATHTGFGYEKNSSGRYYWTQLFLQH